MWSHVFFNFPWFSLVQRVERKIERWCQLYRWPLIEDERYKRCERPRSVLWRIWWVKFAGASVVAGCRSSIPRFQIKAKKRKCAKLFVFFGVKSSENHIEGLKRVSLDADTTSGNSVVGISFDCGFWFYQDWDIMTLTDMYAVRGKTHYRRGKLPDWWEW